MSATMTEQETRKRTKAIHHVVHDYVNLISAGTEIQRSPRPPLNSHVQYSFILQYRKFADFFSSRRRRYRHKKGDIDILAKDFVSGKMHYQLPEWKKWEDHMNAHIFHLNYLRTRNSRPWTGYEENPKMLDEFRAAWRLFFDNLPEPYREEFKKQVALKLASDSDFRDLNLYCGVTSEAVVTTSPRLPHER
jgi:hypothetical protein